MSFSREEMRAALENGPRAGKCINCGLFVEFGTGFTRPNGARVHRPEECHGRALREYKRCELARYLFHGARL